VDAKALDTIANRLLDAFDGRTMIEPFTDTMSDFDGTGAYEVQYLIDVERRRRGWRPAGRKVGFTNRALWDRYGVDGPMWAHVWDRTVTDAPEGTATIDLTPFVQPRIEPEIAFGIASTPPVTDDPEELLGHVEWMAASFEIVQCLFPGWKFRAPDSTAAFGLHGALVAGRRVPIPRANRAAIAAALATFPATLSRDGVEVATGAGANVLGSPVNALGHFVRLLAAQPKSPRLVAGEVVTTGTLTDAQPIESGERWTSDYGGLGVPGLDVVFA
jgi:2-oxo-3-hexenedioate decarboxylase